MGRNPVEPAPHQLYDSLEPGMPYTAPELAAQWDVTRHTMRTRLESLHEDGFVKKKEFDGATVYWIPK